MREAAAAFVASPFMSVDVGGGKGN